MTLLFVAVGCGVLKKEQNLSAQETSAFNTEWKLLQIGSKKMKYAEGEDPITLLMTCEPENLSGFAGCNRYFGKFSVKNNKLSFKQMGVTQIACPEQDTDFENRYLNSLNKVNNYSVENDTLYLRKDDRVLLIYTY